MLVGSHVLDMNVHRVHKITMLLRDWMESSGLKDAALAVSLGLERSFVTKLRLGRAEPSLKVANQIVEITDGAVTFRDLVRERV